MFVGSVGDSYDNALAETVIGLFKTEVVKHLGPWKTMNWVHWCNEDRLHRVIGYQAPNEKENAFHQQHNKLEESAQVLNKTLSEKHKAIQLAKINKPTIEMIKPIAINQWAFDSNHFLNCSVIPRRPISFNPLRLDGAI